MFALKGKVAIVTGGNGGIGLGLARGLATAGSRVVVAARNAEKSRAAVDELARLGAAEPLAIEVDVADESSGSLMTTALRSGTASSTPTSRVGACALVPSIRSSSALAAGRSSTSGRRSLCSATRPSLRTAPRRVGSSSLRSRPRWHGRATTSR